MKTSTLTAIIATAFTLAAFESAQADDLSTNQEGGIVDASASECGSGGDCGGALKKEKISANPEAAGASQKIDTSAQ
jgi:hypothetical protein